jgi:hypothetical protein
MVPVLPVAVTIRAKTPARRINLPVSDDSPHQSAWF